MLHENWKDYSEKEINNVKRSKCMNCPYIGKLCGDSNCNNLNHYFCNYLEIAGERRGCRPENCKHHKDKDVPKASINGMGVRTLRVKKWRKEND